MEPHAEVLRSQFNGAFVEQNFHCPGSRLADHVHTLLGIGMPTGLFKLPEFIRIINSLEPVPL